MANGWVLKQFIAAAGHTAERRKGQSKELSLFMLWYGENLREKQLKQAQIRFYSLFTKFCIHQKNLQICTDNMFVMVLKANHIFLKCVIFCYEHNYQELLVLT